MLVNKILYANVIVFRFKQYFLHSLDQDFPVHNYEKIDQVYHFRKSKYLWALQNSPRLKYLFKKGQI